MKLLVSQNTDPHFNLALEDELVNRAAEDILLIYRNARSVIVGKNQNVFEEMVPENLHSAGIDLVRRISGGGTVYHDLGNVCFSYILRGRDNFFSDFRSLMEPIADFLGTLGLQCDITERNDLFSRGYKISGTAQFRRKDVVMHHGTLLFDADLDSLRSSIKKPEANYDSSAVKSVRSPVANIRELLDLKMDTESFMTELSDYFRLKPYDDSHVNYASVKAEASGRFSSYDWNIAYGPKFTASINGISVKVKKGIITECTHMPYIGKKYSEELLKNLYNESTKL